MNINSAVTWNKFPKINRKNLISLLIYHKINQMN